jgi:hypothetical protein
MPAETNRSRLAEALHGSAFDFLKAIANDRSLDMATRIDAALALGAYLPKPRDCLPDTNNRTVRLCRQHTGHVPTEAERHPPEMRCFPPRDMLDWSEHDDPPGLCPDFHHLDV